MKLRQPRIKLPLMLAAGSLIFILILFLLTSPLKNVGYALPFFVALFIFILSLGSAAVILQTRELSRSAKQRLVLISVLILAVVMFSSSQSLNFIDGLILVLIGGGLYFYFNWR